MKRGYYYTRENTGKINENILNANIQLQDENKYIKNEIKTILERIESKQIKKEELYNLLKSLV